jgi:hypothetical protein
MPLLYHMLPPRKIKPGLSQIRLRANHGVPIKLFPPLFVCSRDVNGRLQQVLKGEKFVDYGNGAGTVTRTEAED